MEWLPSGLVKICCSLGCNVALETRNSAQPFSNEITRVIANREMHAATDALVNEDRIGGCWCARDKHNAVDLHCCSNYSARINRSNRVQGVPYYRRLDYC